LKLVEECSGVGHLVAGERIFRSVSYRISRFQGLAPSGLPIPGLHRIEGMLDLGAIPEAGKLVGSALTLRLADGRSLAITLAGTDGRVLAEGHGPKRGCACC
jgi:hypothetical protein